MIPPAEMEVAARAEAEVTMAYATLSYSLKEVDEAGDILIGFDYSAGDDDDQTWALLDHAFGVVNNWRAAHSFPLNTFQVGMKQRASDIDPTSVAAQRIKRLSSIEMKLRRFQWLKLSSMQDIGGCRAVMSNVKNVRQLCESIKGSRIKHKLDDSDDYIESPKKSGYRGIHLIYEYHSDRKETYNGRKIEMQLRTVLQHAWATAVETVGTFVRQALKSSQGEKEWLRFFALMGSAVALRERTPLVPGTPAVRQELRDELQHYATTLDVERRLEAYGRAMTLASSGLKDAHYFLVRLDPKAQRTAVIGFRTSQLASATREYLRIEREIVKKEGGDAVLVSVESLAALRRAYPNYFLDTRAFVDAVKQALK